MGSKEITIVGTKDDVKKAITDVFANEKMSIEWKDTYSGTAKRGNEWDTAVQNQYYEIRFDIKPLGSNMMILELKNINLPTGTGSIGLFLSSRKYKKVLKSIENGFKEKGMLV